MRTSAPSRYHIIPLAILAVLLVVVTFAEVTGTPTIAESVPNSITPTLQSSLPALPPETFCAQVFRVGTDVPPQIRAWNDPPYYKCVEGQKSPALFTGAISDKAKNMGLPTLSPPQTVSLPHFAAGAGTVIEDGSWEYGAPFLLQNEWREVIGGKMIRVLAGAKRTNGVEALPRPWPGLVIVEMRTPDGASFASNGGGIFYTPSRVGPVRIVDANGERLVLRSDSGATFYFDVPTLRFYSALTGGVAITTAATPNATLPATPVLPAYP